MNIDQVYEWVKKDVGIDEEQAIKLKKQELMVILLFHQLEKI